MLNDIRVPGILHKILGANIGENVGNKIIVGPQGLYAIVPLTVLNAAAALLAGVFSGQLNGAVITKPANMLEGPPGFGLHLLHPGAHHGGIR